MRVRVLRGVLFGAAALMLVSGGAFAQAPAAAPQTKGSAAPAATAKGAAAEPAGKSDLVDINSATMEQLDALKGVGAKRAADIVKGRPYKGKDELYQKKIIPKGVYDGIKDKIIARQK